MFTRNSLALLLALLLSPWAAAQVEVRVATWNVLGVGTPGSAEFQAAVDVLRRVDADVVAIAEISSDADVPNFLSLASAAGYAYTVVAPYGPFGSPRTGFLSRHAVSTSTAWSAAALSGDSAANDLTRYLLEANVDVTGRGDLLRLLTTHWKSGTANSDEFRRAVESYRMSGLTAGTPAGRGLVLMGDVNADIGDPPATPALFTAAPTGLPTSFVIGADVNSMMAAGGLVNDPFAYLTRGAVVLDALQQDGTDATRPASGRRIDYLLANAAIVTLGARAQVYDCADETLASPLPLAGTPLPAATCATASDHLPVFADLVVPASAVVVTPTYTLNPTSLSFGKIRRTRISAAKAVTVSNTGSVGLPITSIGLQGTQANQFAYSSNCPATLAVAATCTVSVTFRPTSTGAKSATLVLTPGAGAAVKSVALSGTGS